MAGNNITRCICHSRTFDEVKAYAEEHGLTSVNELENHNFCSNSCGLCVPYVKVLLKTGQTEFSPGEPYRNR